MLEGVDNEYRRGESTYQYFRKGLNGWKKGKYCIRVLEIIGATPASPNNADEDAEKGDG